jgi:gamma-glutamyl phosphate reductase
MTTKTFRTMALAGLMALASVTPALADDDEERWGMGWMMRHMMGMDMVDMSERVEGRLAFLKTELKITEAQTTAWNKLADTIRTTAATHGAMMKSHMEEMRDGSFLEKPLPDRLTFMETMMSARLEQVRSVHAAVDELYAALNDDQRKEADKIALPMMGMGMGRGMGGGMMMQ